MTLNLCAALCVSVFEQPTLLDLLCIQLLHITNHRPRIVSGAQIEEAHGCLSTVHRGHIFHVHFRFTATRATFAF